MHEQTISKNGEKEVRGLCLLSMFRCHVLLSLSASLWGKKRPLELAAAFVDVRRKQRPPTLIRESGTYCYFYKKERAAYRVASGTVTPMCRAWTTLEYRGVVSSALLQSDVQPSRPT